jgi:Uma2 family endonuclease
MSTSALMTAAEFDNLPDDDQEHELLGGEHLVSAFPKWRHIVLQHRLSAVIGKHAPEGWMCLVEGGYELSDDTLLRPDVSVASREQIESAKGDEWVRGAPPLVVEIVSPSNTAAEVVRKVDAYLLHGAREVWVVYPALKQIHVHEPGGMTSRHSDQVSSTSIPGLMIKLDELFAGL